MGNEWQNKQNKQAGQKSPESSMVPPVMDPPPVLQSARAPEQMIPPEPTVQVPLNAFEKLMQRLEVLEKQISAVGKTSGTPEASPMAVADLKPMVNKPSNRDPDNPNDKNPCGCEDCTPFKVHHWWCTACGNGPYKFEKTDPGRYRTMLPPYRRQMQRYIVRGYAFDRDGQRYPIQQWVYWARYACSSACAAMEQSQVADDQWELGQKRPDMLKSIESVNRQLTAHEREAVGAAQADDLS